MKQKEIQNIIERYNIKYLTPEEVEIMIGNSTDEDYIHMIDKFKRNNPDKFNKEFVRLSSPPPKEPTPIIHRTYQPKCPTCGSPDVKKIGSGKRLVSIGFFGLASSNLGKTMQCGSCGAKW